MNIAARAAPQNRGDRVPNARIRSRWSGAVLAAILPLLGPSLAASAPPDSAAVAPASATAPAPASGLVGTDAPNDAGREIDLTWKPSADDVAGQSRVAQYFVERATTPEGPWTIVDSV